MLTDGEVLREQKIAVRAGLTVDPRRRVGSFAIILEELAANSASVTFLPVLYR